jgi:hypothetical protein
MGTIGDAMVSRALDEARETTRVLEGLQVLREAEARASVRYPLEVAARWRDVQSRRLRAQLDKLARLRSRTRRLSTALAANPLEPLATTMTRTSWRVLLGVTWCAAMFSQQGHPFLRASVPVVAVWLALGAALLWRRR